MITLKQPADWAKPATTFRRLWAASWKGSGTRATRPYSISRSALTGSSRSELRVPREAFKKAYGLVDPETISSLEFAADQIRYFAQQQLQCLKPLECQHIPGVTLGHRLIPIQSCGAYVPAGRYPLPSTALMSTIPAKVAGVERVAACSPPSREYGTIHPAVLVAMDMAGVDEAYCMGGAQAIAAYTYGTQSVPRVDIIVGPGNRFVTEAKRQVGGAVGIDMLAGPSEALIVADDTAPAQLVAVDLLSQCEHDPNSLAILVTTSHRLAGEVQKVIQEELKTLGTAALAGQTWEDNGQVILADSLDEAIGYPTVCSRAPPGDDRLRRRDGGQAA